MYVCVYVSCYDRRKEHRQQISLSLIRRCARTRTAGSSVKHKRLLVFVSPSLYSRRNTLDLNQAVPNLPNGTTLCTGAYRALGSRMNQNLLCPPPSTDIFRLFPGDRTLETLETLLQTSPYDSGNLNISIYSKESARGVDFQPLFTVVWLVSAGRQ